MKNWIKLIGAFLIFIIAAITFFCPILISILVDDWWFILLFGVTWIPAVSIIIFLQMFIIFLDDRQR